VPLRALFSHACEGRPPTDPDLPVCMGSCFRFSPQFPPAVSTQGPPPVSFFVKRTFPYLTRSPSTFREFSVLFLLPLLFLLRGTGRFWSNVCYPPLPCFYVTTGLVSLLLSPSKHKSLNFLTTSFSACVVLSEGPYGNALMDQHNGNLPSPFPACITFFPFF